MSITVVESSKVTGPGSAEVTLKNAIVFVLNGAVVGRVDAVYNLKDLPPALHTAAIQVAWHARNTIDVTPSYPNPEPDPEETLKAPIVKNPWWRRLW